MLEQDILSKQPASIAKVVDNMSTSRTLDVKPIVHEHLFLAYMNLAAEVFAFIFKI